MVPSCSAHIFQNVEYICQVRVLQQIYNVHYVNMKLLEINNPYKILSINDLINKPSFENKFKNSSTFNTNEIFSIIVEHALHITLMSKQS